MTRLESEDGNCREFEKQDPGMWVALTTLLPGEVQGSSGYARHHSRVKDACEDTASYLYRRVIGFFLSFFAHFLPHA